MAEDDTEQNPFTRPGFIVGAVVVAALIVAAIVLTVINLNRGNDAAPPAPDPSSSATASAAPSPEESEAAGGASVCGLEGVELTGNVTTAPAAEWAFVRTVAYPTSRSSDPLTLARRAIRRASSTHRKVRCSPLQRLWPSRLTVRSCSRGSTTR